MACKSALESARAINKRERENRERQTGMGGLSMSLRNKNHKIPVKLTFLGNQMLHLRLSRDLYKPEILSKG